MDGRILAASHHGAYVLRLEGDVRVTLCATIDDYIKRMFDDPEFTSVWVDLCAAEGIDSTTLGLLAQLALQAREQYGFSPALYSCDPGINRLLRTMDFQRLFEMHDETCSGSDAVREIPAVEGSEAAVRDKVIEAHRVLMGLSDENRARFKDLMTVLERG